MEDIKEPLNVLVCGTNFGRVYIKGIQKNKKFRIAGILSHGSEQSKRIAKEYNVPLYTDIDKISKREFDLACVVVRSTVVGGKGSSIANELLCKGIDVIQEHPVHYNDLIQAIKLARKNDCIYQVNSFYPFIKSVGRFIELSNKALAIGQPLYIDASCSLQVLFPMIDIFGRALGGFSPWVFQNIESGESGLPFSILTGKIKDIPIILKIQNQIDPADPDNNGFLLHRVIIGTTEGTLNLTDSNGQVQWNPQMYVPHNSEGVLDMYGDNHYLNLHVSEEVPDIHIGQYREVYENVWPSGISVMLDNFIKIKADKRQRELQTQRLLTASKIWREIAEAIGNPQFIKTPDRKGISLSEIDR